MGDVNVLDGLIYNFQTLADSGISTITAYAMGTLGALMTIDFILSVILNLDEGDKIKLLASKVLKYGIWIFFISNWGNLLNVILESFKIVGLSIGGSAVMVDIMSHPSRIVWLGLDIILPLLDSLR